MTGGVWGFIFGVDVALCAVEVEVEVAHGGGNGKESFVV
jgi:hypothetical protein